jgi:hypothetical protein
LHLLLQLVEFNSEKIKDYSYLVAILNIICCEISFDSAECTFYSVFIWIYQEIVSKLADEKETAAAKKSPLAEAKSFSTQLQVGIQCLNVLYQFHLNASSILQQNIDFWNKFHLPIFNELMHQCQHPAREMRLHALAITQKALLHPTFHKEQFVYLIFDSVLVPFLVHLLESQPTLENEAIVELQIRVSTMACKVFLQYIHVLSHEQMEGILTLLLRVLGRYLNLEESLVKEAVTESLKNVLLVIRNSEAAIPCELWDKVWEILEDALLSLKEEFAGKQELQESDAQSVKDSVAPLQIKVAGQDGNESVEYGKISSV